MSSTSGASASPWNTLSHVGRAANALSSIDETGEGESGNTSLLDAQHVPCGVGGVGTVTTTTNRNDDLVDSKEADANEAGTTGFKLCCLTCPPRMPACHMPACTVGFQMPAGKEVAQSLRNHGFDASSAIACLGATAMTSVKFLAHIVTSTDPKTMEMSQPATVLMQSCLFIQVMNMGLGCAVNEGWDKVSALRTATLIGGAGAMAAMYAGLTPGLTVLAMGTLSGLHLVVLGIQTGRDANRMAQQRRITDAHRPFPEAVVGTGNGTQQEVDV